MYSVDILALVQQEQRQDRLWEAEQWRLHRAIKPARRKQNMIQSIMLRLQVPTGRKFLRTRLVGGRQAQRVGQR